MLFCGGSRQRGRRGARRVPEAFASRANRARGTAEAALPLPPEQATMRLQEIQEGVKQLNPFFLEMIPSLAKINDARLEIKTSRAKLLLIGKN
jgi:hypothetical protein